MSHFHSDVYLKSWDNSDKPETYAYFLNQHLNNFWGLKYQALKIRIVIMNCNWFSLFERAYDLWLKADSWSLNFKI